MCVRARSVLVLLVFAATAGLAGCGNGDDSPASGDSTAAETGEPREVVSSRSAPFQKYSGEGAGALRIAEFGTEGSGDDRLAVQAVVDGYLAASSKGKWARACAYASLALLEQIDEIIRNTTRTPKPTCGEVLEALAIAPTGGVPLPPRNLTVPQGIASLRIKEGPGGGFALFRGSDGKDYWMAVKRADGSWGVISVVPQAFILQSS